MSTEHKVHIPIDFSEEALSLATEMKDSLPNTWELLYHNGLMPEVMAFIKQRETLARINERKAMGARLNQNIFFSTTEPKGQFVKDCIIEELDQAENDRLAELKEGLDTNHD